MHNLQTVNAFFLCQCWRISDVSVSGLEWQHRSLYAHTHIKASSVLQSTIQLVQEMVSVTQGYHSHESRETKVGKKLLIWLEHSWENKAYQPTAPFHGQRKKNTGYCVIKRSVQKLSLIRKQTVLWCQPCWNFELKRLPGITKCKQLGL